MKSIFDVNPGDQIQAVAIPGTPFVFQPRGQVYVVLRDSIEDEALTQRMRAHLGAALKTAAVAHEMGRWLSAEYCRESVMIVDGHWRLARHTATAIRMRAYDKANGITRARLDFEAISEAYDRIIREEWRQTRYAHPVCSACRSDGACVCDSLADARYD